MSRVGEDDEHPTTVVGICCSADQAIRLQFGDHGTGTLVPHTPAARETGDALLTIAREQTQDFGLSRAGGAFNRTHGTDELTQGLTQPFGVLELVLRQIGRI